MDRLRADVERPAVQPRPAAGNAPASERYTVAGRIAGSRKDLLTVNTGRAVVRVQVAADAKDHAVLGEATPADAKANQPRGSFQ